MREGASWPTEKLRHDITIHIIIIIIYYYTTFYVVIVGVTFGLVCIIMRFFLVYF